MDPAVRLLRLLSTLQSRSNWEGRELADRLAVTGRTLRRDVGRLRELGYPVDATPGRGGGYRLGTGGRLPPLLLDDDEAVAIAVGLRVATTATVSGVEDAAVGALAKLDQLLPPRLADRVRAIGAGTVQTPRGDLPQVDSEVLVTLAAACRRSEGVRFGYRTHHGRSSQRSAEPLRVVHTGRRWYLVARDRDADDWRTFRIDRITDPALTGRRYSFDDPPDPIALVAESTGVAPWSVQARLVLHIDAATAARYIPPPMGVVEPLDDSRCTLRIAAEALAPLVDYVLRLPWEFGIAEPDELRVAVRDQADRLQRAARVDSHCG